MRETFYYFIKLPNKFFFFFLVLSAIVHIYKQMCTVTEYLKFLLMPPLLQRDFCVCGAKF